MIHSVLVGQPFTEWLVPDTRERVSGWLREPLADGDTQFGTVVPGSCADKGGIVAGDVAETWNGARIRKIGRAHV